MCFRAGDGFSRDGFGRQSMSEKRKGHSDPRASEIYQKVRGLKELNKGMCITLELVFTLVLFLGIWSIKQNQLQSIMLLSYYHLK